MSAVQMVGGVFVAVAVTYFLVAAGTAVAVLWGARRLERRRLSGECRCPGCRSIVEVIR